MGGLPRPSSCRAHGVAIFRFSAMFHFWFFVEHMFLLIFNIFDIVRIRTRCLSVVQATTFIAMASKRSNNNAKQPLEKTTAIASDSSSLPESSAARPASKAGGPAELLNLRECKNWLQALPSQEILQNKPLQRLQVVMDLLQRPPSLSLIHISEPTRPY